MIDWTLFNGADWAIVALLTLSVLVSLWRGFVREAVSLAGWIAAFVIANMFAMELSLLLSNWFASATGRYIAAYAMLFIATLLTAGLLRRLGSSVVRATGLSLLDRLLGTVFGFTRGIIVILVVVYVVRNLVPPENLQSLNQSQLMPHVDMLVQWAQMVFMRFNQEIGPGLTA